MCLMILHQLCFRLCLLSLELTIPIINFLSINLEIALKTLQIENFKKHLKTNILPTTRQPKKLQHILVREKI